MALIKFGGGVVGMSGSIAGNTFSRNRYGAYARSRSVPVNPNTARQQTVRNSLAALTMVWSQTLTAAQRAAWNLYAANVVMTNRLGESINLSGFNHFLRSNSLLQQNAKTLVADGPTTFEIPESDPAFAISASEATQVISVTYDDTLDWCDEDEAYMFLFQGQPQNAQRNFFGGPWRQMTPVEGDSTTPPTSPESASAVFAITEGQRQWVYGRILRADGRLSAPFRGDCFVGA